MKRFEAWWAELTPEDENCLRLKAVASMVTVPRGNPSSLAEAGTYTSSALLDAQRGLAKRASRDTSPFSNCFSGREID